MRVLLVDDHLLMLDGLKRLLELHDILVAGQATGGSEAVLKARELKPDVILMDIRMPGVNGLEATRLIKADMPEVKIVVLTTSDEDQDLFEAVKSGACGYLIKSVDAAELIEALHQAMQDIPPFSPGLASKLLKEFAREGKPNGVVNHSPPISMPKTPSVAGLSPRQHEILVLLAEGLSYKEAGTRLDLSPNTIKYHVAEIMRRLHLQNHAQVLAYAGSIASKATRSTD